jgi:hypothetical protein
MDADGSAVFVGLLEFPLRAVNPISRSQWNDGFGPDSGPSGGDPCRHALRPSETIAIRLTTDRLDPLLPFKIGPMMGGKRRKRFRSKA